MGDVSFVLAIDQIAATLKYAGGFIGKFFAALKEFAAAGVKFVAGFAEAFAALARSGLNLRASFFAGLRGEEETDRYAQGEAGEKPDCVFSMFMRHNTTTLVLG